MTEATPEKRGDTIEYIRTMLETVLEHTDDPDDQYRLRTVLQYLDLLEETEQELVNLATDSSRDTEESEAVTNRLDELGYLE